MRRRLIERWLGVGIVFAILWLGIIEGALAQTNTRTGDVQLRVQGDAINGLTAELTGVMTDLTPDDVYEATVRFTSRNGEMEKVCTVSKRMRSFKKTIQA